MRRDERPRRWATRGLLVVALTLAAAASVGCEQQQLEERNAALQKQLEQALVKNADLQAESDRLQGENQQLVSELARARDTARQAAAQPAQAKPDFGKGVDVSVKGGVTTVTLPNTILFDVGRATLKSSSKRVLDKIASVLGSQYKGQTIRVEGHTDSQPIRKTKKLWKDNWDLSCNRAMAVVRYLVAKGLDPKRTYAAGFSYYRPVASNRTAKGQAQNRRVAIVVSPH
ncbi:MAG: OmpA family protein [Planctomycetota bacterium]|nr:OmpA family protein [Planctomycetota bacterium]